MAFWPHYAIERNMRVDEISSTVQDSVKWKGHRCLKDEPNTCLTKDMKDKQA